jgi:hypothetical protein
MNVGPFTPLLAQFNQNWTTHAADLAVQLDGQDLSLEGSHPLSGELLSLCSGRAASLPFFTKNDVVWCTLGPNNESLKQAVAALNAWILPSFGGEGNGDGYVHPASATGGLAATILAISPSGYYRWRCPRTVTSQVLEKLILQRSLEKARPPRTRLPCPSLYELRARFMAALLVGDRNGAEQVIGQLDSLQLDSAVNTQFMRIRLWSHFRELDRIRQHPDLPQLLAQPLPPRVRAWIDEALGAQKPSLALSPAPAIKPEEVEAPPTWVGWFDLVKRGDKPAAEVFLEERHHAPPYDLSPGTIEALVHGLEELFLDDALRNRERPMILQGIAELLNEFVREPGFPRATLGDLYLALLRLWSALFAGNSTGQEHAHVLLELASAALRLNRDPRTVLTLLEDWWRARPVPSQLIYILDAIELLERESPDVDATVNLWFAAADVIKRFPDALIATEQALWRHAGLRLGIEQSDIDQYLPPEKPTAEKEDPLAAARLHRIAIVCLREKQAQEAASILRDRTAAEVSIVTSTTAGPETTQARLSDVVLFVWMASTHAVFRAFDDFDRNRLAYVQGTGSASIVRTLERWSLQHLPQGTE